MWVSWQGIMALMNRIGETAIPDRRRNNSDCWANTIQHRYPLWLAANDRVEALKNCRLVEQSREQHFLDTLFKGTIVWNSLELMCVIDPPKSLALHFLVYGAPSLQHPCKMWQSRRLCPPLVQHAVTKRMDQRNRKKCDAATLGAVAVLWGCQHGQKSRQYNKSVHKENMVTRLKLHQSTLLCPRVWRLPATQSRSPRIRILGRNQICKWDLWSLYNWIIGCNLSYASPVPVSESAIVTINIWSPLLSAAQANSDPLLLVYFCMQLDILRYTIFLGKSASGIN